MQTVTETTPSARSLLSKVQKSVEKIKSDDMQYFPEAASCGDYVRQGDIYITLLGRVPAKASRMTEVDLKLAPGNTRGSRHILDSSVGVEMFQVENATVLDGPIIRLTEDRVVTHPEHGDFTLNKGCVYGITYQRQHAEELRRIAD